MSDLNLDKFLKDRKKREKEKTNSYKKIYKYVATLISEGIKQDHHYIHYDIPIFDHESPDYEALECISYVLDKLKEQVLFKKIVSDIKILEPNTLYISWDLKKLD